MGLHSGKSVEDDGPVTSVNIVESVIDDGAADGETETELAYSIKELCCHLKI